MYIDRDAALQHPIASMPFEVERGRIRFFARTIGLTDPIYSDVEAARAAGHRDLPAPLTFLSNSLELELPHPLGWLEEVGGDLTKTTHAEQAFTYHSLAYAGDSLLFERRIIDVYTKKGGALEFAVKQTKVKRDTELLLEARCIIALRHPEALK
ncbi:MaoC family dehydratase N-terminal domain-containing protein [Novosphingobium album (ex Liu et al. 2023)]|uniref:MaoC family dehydratase N-terminal domain-containing protein n=1 Tax=Novosphingobium album (ex Liu et al. 2023) TaxID=3031130 RepID=A0ABT5WRP9_9SPHN|nr:MaoC family dehydratase N-terminal domain-containing protein [Novosphingobium album (ex Liu et al. 2023)]MDE8652421.1 MaoC family dehydratase N-terminal domain-containing protein [Novosphingobium album (ex Liu et al. 2023)]